MSSTPEVLEKLGAKQFPIVISHSILQKTIYPEGIGTGKHIIPIDELKKLTRELYEPIMILRAEQAGRIVVITGMKDKGENVIVAIQMNTAHRRYEVHEIITLHGRGTGWIENRVINGNLLYYDKTKSLNSAEIQRAYASSLKMPNKGSNKTILSDDDIVKPNFEDKPLLKLGKPSPESIAEVEDVIKNVFARAEIMLGKGTVSEGFQPSANILDALSTNVKSRALVSIHAPARGATCFGLSCLRHIFCFNPRAPAERDLYASPLKVIGSFLPRIRKMTAQFPSSI
ncbi:MAG: hypothetical protein NTW44_03710 [Nitrospirae bacterium]|nr:hypothetical protein [Nitrospirota bacterium]